MEAADSSETLVTIYLNCMTSCPRKSYWSSRSTPYSLLSWKASPNRVKKNSAS